MANSSARRRPRRLPVTAILPSPVTFFLALTGPVFSVTELTAGVNAGKYLIGGQFTDAGGDAATDRVARLITQSQTHTVTFVVHGGSGSMPNQVATVATALDANTFTRVWDLELGGA